MTGLGARLRAATAARGALCVGIDPHAALLRAWGLPDSASGARELALTVVDAAAWLAGGAPLESDALTVAPYLGLGALDPLIRIAQEAGNGVFVLASTSNPEGVAVQSARTADGGTVAAAIAREAADRNATAAAAGEWGDIGVVIGATRPLAESGIAADALAATPILAPGFGAQGARLADIGAIFGAAAATVIPSVSRSVLEAGPEGIAAAIDAHRAELSA